MRKFIEVLLVWALLPATLHAASTDEIRTWNESLQAFTTSLDDAEPIDKYLTQTTSSHASVSFGNTVYTAYTQSDGTETHVYLSRINGGNLSVWDDDLDTNGGWNTDLQRADPIDARINGQDSKNPAIAADSTGNIYIAYLMEDPSQNDHLFLSRFNVLTQRMEIWDRSGANDWTTTRSDVNQLGNSIDAEGDSTSQAVSGMPGMVVNNNNDVLIAYLQSDGVQNHLYVTRYDASVNRIEGWDTALSQFTTVRNDFEDAGDEIDHTRAASATRSFDMATGGTDGHVYFVYEQEQWGSPDFHIGLTRYNGQTELIERWDQTTQAWTLNHLDADDDADFIDVKAVSASTDNAGNPRVVVSSIGDAYIVYEMDDATPDSHIYMTKYNDTLTRVSAWNTAMNGGVGGFVIIPEPITISSYVAGMANGDEANDSLDAQIAAKDANTIRLAIDSNDNVYVAFLQEDATGNNDHIFLTRLAAATDTIEYWSDDTESWESEASEMAGAADMIDLNSSASESFDLIMAVDKKDDVYLAYIQQDAGGTNNHLKLTRYDSSTALIEGWDNFTASFITDLSLVDDIDISTTTRVSSQPDIVITNSGTVYIPYLQLGEQEHGATTHLQLSAFIPASSTSITNDGGGSMSLGMLILLALMGVIGRGFKGKTVPFTKNF